MSKELKEALRPIVQELMAETARKEAKIHTTKKDIVFELLQALDAAEDAEKKEAPPREKSAEYVFQHLRNQSKRGYQHRPFSHVDRMINDRLRLNALYRDTLYHSPANNQTLPRTSPNLSGHAKQYQDNKSIQSNHTPLKDASRCLPRAGRKALPILLVGAIATIALINGIRRSPSS